MSDEAAIARLSVYIDGDCIGTLHRTDPLSFTYTPAWLDRKGAVALHPSIPLAPGIQQSPVVHAFFENLLPEGDQRRIIGMRHHVTSVFGLLALAGGDTAGAVVLVPEGQVPEPPAYQPLTWEQVNALLYTNGDFVKERQAIEAAAAGLPRPRLSISGAQLKLLLSLDADGMPLRPMGNSPSTHILKPDIVRSDLKLFATAVNETIVMHAAQLCELPAARVAYQPQTKACLVERYDRKPRADGSLARLWQADFCQIDGKPSDVKYELDGGPSLKTCFDIVRRESVQPAVDQRQLLRWVFFNLYVGNNDSHAKNLSLLATPDGLRLAPFYDMMSTRVYSGLASHFAFRIGGENEPGQLGPAHLKALAAELRMSPRFVTAIAQQVAAQVEAAIPQAAEWVMRDLGPSEQVMGERLQHKIRAIVTRMRARLLEP
ncbi:MAG TPA: type II toxin-antitoxin system HipA family toxin [Noviherbaspirillum sp.]|jgi:serine/threonine-protein kinase HipA|uniref:type II toxin-antitoxin system HipA family toxin n=1 Tax=Noviherbaspirillum sp. TaxID=1926288 RepID=UPI002F935D43